MSPVDPHALARLFPFLDGERAGLVAERMTSRRLEAGETAWAEGDSADALALILSGTLELKKETEFAGSHVVVGLYGPGAVIGEACILAGRRALTAKATEPAELALLSSRTLSFLCDAHPALATRLLKFLLLSSSQRLDQSYRRIASVF